MKSSRQIILLIALVAALGALPACESVESIFTEDEIITEINSDGVEHSRTNAIANPNIVNAISAAQGTAGMFGPQAEAIAGLAGGAILVFQGWLVRRRTARLNREKLVSAELVSDIEMLLKRASEDGLLDADQLRDWRTKLRESQNLAGVWDDINQIIKRNR